MDMLLKVAKTAAAVVKTTCKTMARMMTQKTRIAIITHLKTTKVAQTTQTDEDDSDFDTSSYKDGMMKRCLQGNNE